MKKYVDEKYAVIILQLAHKYQNENSSCRGGAVYAAMDRTLSTMDIYTANINRMGYMMYTDSIAVMLDYIPGLVQQGCEFSTAELLSLYDYLKSL